MRKNEDRKQAEQRFLRDRGRVTNKELAKALGVHPATVARWKKLDEWDVKLVQSISTPQEAVAGDDDFFEVDLRQLNQLNDRIDGHLQKKELLPAEILDLAQAKFHIMSCMEIIRDHMRYPPTDTWYEEEPE